MNEEENRTLYVGNLHSDITEELLYELFLQAGPVQYVKIPIDKATKKAKSFGFVCFKDEVSVPYGYYLLDNIKLLGRYLRVQPRNRNLETPPVQFVGIHTLEPQDDQKDAKNSNNIASNLPPQFKFNPSLLPANVNVMGAQNMGNNQGTNHDFGFPFASPPSSPYPFTHGFRVKPTVDTNYLNNFKNMHDGSFQSDSNRYQHNVQDFKDSKNNYQHGNDSNRRDSYNRDRRSDGRSPGDSSSSSRWGYKEFDNSSRLNERLEYPKNSKNHNWQHDKRDSGDGRDNRDSYNNRDYNFSQNRRDYESRDYGGGGGDHNRRNSYNNNRRNNNNNGSSSSRNHDVGSGNNGRQYYDNHSRY